MPREPRWKKYERELARDVGLERIPATGERDGADFQNAVFLYQAKRRKDALPAEVLGWLEAAVAKAAESGRTAVVVVQRRGLNRGESVVLLRWTDWVELHGNHPEEG